MVEFVGASPTVSEDPSRNAIAQTAAALRHLDGVELVAARGPIEGGKVAQRLSRLKLGIWIEP